MRAETKFNMAVVLVLGAIAMTALVLFNTRDRDSETRTTIEKSAAMLREADQRGDSGAATAMLQSSVDLLRRLNDETAASGVQPGCLLPAVHLSDGVVSVAKGGRWDSQDRYDASLSRCR